MVSFTTAVFTHNRGNGAWYFRLVLRKNRAGHGSRVSHGSASAVMFVDLCVLSHVHWVFLCLSVCCVACVLCPLYHHWFFGSVNWPGDRCYSLFRYPFSFFRNSMNGSSACILPSTAVFDLYRVYVVSMLSAAFLVSTSLS